LAIILACKRHQQTAKCIYIALLL